MVHRALWLGSRQPLQAAQANSCLLLIKGVGICLRGGLSGPGGQRADKRTRLQTDGSKLRAFGAHPKSRPLPNPITMAGPLAEHVLFTPDHAIHLLETLGLLDTHARNAISRVSKGGLDCILSCAPKARLRLSLAACARHSTISAVRARLLTRGRLPTALVLECGHSPVSAAVLAQVSALAQCLQGASQGIREVELRGTSATEPMPTCTTAQLMQRVVLPALPHITTLTLTHCPCSLPAPAQLSQLRKVSVTVPTEPDHAPVDQPSFSRLARFLSQITSLEMYNCRATAACSVFSQASPHPHSHALRHGCAPDRCANPAPDRQGAGA